MAIAKYKRTVSCMLIGIGVAAPMQFCCLWPSWKLFVFVDVVSILAVALIVLVVEWKE